MSWFPWMYCGSWLSTSRRQSIAAPSRISDDFSSAIRASVNPRGCAAALIAAFSAGSPNESNPIGRQDRVALHPLVPRTTRSPIGVLAHVPWWAEPDGYGYMHSA